MVIWRFRKDLLGSVPPTFTVFSFRMKKRIKSTLETIAHQIPLSLYNRIMHRDVIDYFWHAVSDEPMPHVRHLYPVIPTADFESALLYLKDNYNFVSYQQLHAHIFDGAQLPPMAVHLSFDDGYAECYSTVRPLLLKHEIPCTFFLTTSLIDNPILFYRNKQSLCVERLITPTFTLQSSIANLQSQISHKLPSTPSEFVSWFKDLRLPDEPLIDEICCALEVDWQSFLAKKQPYLTTGQIREMQSEGFTMGAHTLTHRKLIDLPNEEVETEITESCQVVGEITGQEIVPFSFPHSAWGLDRDYLSAVRSRNPKIGLLFDTKGVRQDEAIIHNRIWAERPILGRSQKGSGADEIKEHLRLAYQEAWVDEIMAKGRRLRQ